MLQITIPATELWNEKTNEFVKIKEQILQLEHSLVSLSKWESKWCKPFMSKTEKTSEETIDYIRCMTVTQNVDFDVYNCITNEIINEVSTYIEAPMTATTFSDDNKNVINREIITAEIIYYWMVALTIPFECQKWHLNRLLTLINVCNIKNQPKKKTGKGNIYARNRALNEARKKELNTAG
jgi:hypothetical protein